ncbi:hypothetical protein TrLO_g4315 [Triparma laevis f. longispina]|uniref:Peptidase S1 domain-containing protein n=1 Tax=Triparma laevis f. longispina TaxID=1714387 RepID=A0A9W7KX59_9STRA|nr:hypothetical protein TrLO_g4315 [Triparma laevis f. longispina]
MLRHIEADKRNKRTRKPNGDKLRSEFDDRRDFINGEDKLRTVRETRVGQRGRTSKKPSNYPSNNHHSRIVGGSTADEDDYPWMVSLQQTWGHFCGGSLISSQWVLTAAHCVVDGAEFFVEVGRYHLFNESEAVFHRVQIAEVHPHVCYDGSGDMSYDVALVKLAEPVDNPFIDLFSGIESDIFNPGVSFATIAGWGNMEVAPFWPEHLQHVTVPTITNEACESAYGASSITDAMVCAGEVEDGGVDSCQGDSGGPLFVHRAGKYIQVGVVSWGIGCADPGYPGVYADVATVHSWITGFVSGTDMNEAEKNATNACPLRNSPGLPDFVEDDWDWDWIDTETYNNTDCDGVLFSDSYLWWVGDCYCDGTNSSYHLNLNCSAWKWDGGDCNSDFQFDSTACSGGSTDPYVPSNGNCTHFSCLDSTSCVDNYVLDFNWIGDGICDLVLNCSEYTLDGGDCAGIGPDDDYSSGGGSSTCENYACEGYDSTVCVDQYLAWEWINDDYCDYALFCEKYEFDGGDCDNVDYSEYYSGDYDPGSYDYGGDSSGDCENYACSSYYDPTHCVDQYLSWDWINDGYCDSSLNCAEYEWDGTDCGNNDDYSYSGDYSDSGGSESCDVSRVISQKNQCTSDGVALYQWSGDSCDSENPLRFFESNNYYPNEDGSFVELGSCAKLTDLFEDTAGSYQYGFSADDLYASADCENSASAGWGIGLKMYVDSQCNSQVGSLHVPMGSCDVETDCVSETEDGDDFRNGRYIWGECSSGEDSWFRLSLYETNNNCQNDQNMIGTWTDYEGLGYSEEEGHSVFGDCKPLPKNEVRGAFLFNDEEDLYVTESCNSGFPKFAIYKNEDCSGETVRMLDFNVNCQLWVGEDTGESDTPGTSDFDPYGIVVSAEMKILGVSESTFYDSEVKFTFYSVFEESIASSLGVSANQVEVTGHSFGSRRAMARARVMTASPTCCDVDGSCVDGDDDWCCDGEFYCSNDGELYAESMGGIPCPSAMSCGGELSMFFTVTHLISNEDDESQVSFLVGATAEAINYQTESESDLDAIMKENLKSAGIWESGFQEMECKEVEVQEDHSINDDREYLLTLSAGATVRSGGAIGVALGVWLLGVLLF